MEKQPNKAKGKKRGNKRKQNWAERRKSKARRRNQQEGEGDNHTYATTHYSYCSVKFDLYYRRLLDPILDAGSATTKDEIKKNKDEDFRQMRAYLKEKLPITFRVNPINVGYEKITRQFSSENFVKDWIDSNKDNPDFQGKKGRISSIDEDKIHEIKLINHEFYPEKLLYQLPLAREVLKKDVVLTSIHKFIQKCNDSGVLTRQEVVSMIPPLLLDVKTGHKIYDACAAPGSKTAQLLEFSLKDIKGKDLLLNPGFVIANDADESRANMLAHQMSRFNYGAIVNHDAQNFPTLHYQQGTDAYSNIDSSNFDTRAHFDRVVCDVPCSSDAAIRKIPRKWDLWDPNDGASLHPLQLKILIRSLNLLKPNSEDSYLTYSTCSINPIENEAVVHAALKQLNSNCAPGQEEYELIDCSQKLHPFKTRPGLLSWKVYDSLPKHRRKRLQKLINKQRDARQQQEDSKNAPEEKDGEQQPDQEEVKQEGEGDANAQQTPQEVEDEYKDCLEVDIDFEDYFREYKTVEDIVPERKPRFCETMFPPQGTEQEIEDKYHLSRCIRVFANDQDTSGFFIALIRRKPTSVPVQKATTEETKAEEKPKSDIVPVQKPLKNMIRCDPNDPDIEFIKTYYAISDDFPLDQIFTFSENMNKLLLLNKGLSDYLYADQNKQINLIAAGAETFIRNSSKNFSGVDCIFRISQNGVRHVYPFMNKRVYYVNLDLFKFLVYNKRVDVENLKDEEFRKEMEKLSCGCFVVVTKLEDDKEEALVLHRHFKHINTMVSDLNLHKIKVCLGDI